MSLPDYEVIKSEIKKQLIKNAQACTYYVAFGEVMRREIAKQFNISADKARELLDKQAVELCDRIGG